MDCLLFLLLLCLGAHVPRLDDPTLRLVDIFLILHLAYSDLDAVLGEDHVLTAHLRFRRLAHLRNAQVDVVTNKGQAADEEEDDKQG